MGKHPPDNAKPYEILTEKLRLLCTDLNIPELLATYNRGLKSIATLPDDGLRKGIGLVWRNAYLDRSEEDDKKLGGFLHLIIKTEYRRKIVRLSPSYLQLCQKGKVGDWRCEEAHNLQK